MDESQFASDCQRLKQCPCGCCYTIHHSKFGVLFSAPIPIFESIKIMEYYAEGFGYDLCDSLIASHFKCSLCLTTKKLSEAWRKKLNIEKTEEKEKEIEDAL